MSLGIKGLTINMGSLVGRTFSRQTTIGGLVLVLVLLFIGAVFYLSPTKIWWGIKPKLPEINWQLLLARLAIEKSAEETVFPEDLEIILPQLTKTYQESAQPGEGITHLSRRALKTYLKEKGSDLKLTAEHKIYIEDYLAKKIGGDWLALGQALSFSENLIIEAIQKAQELTPDQLENLQQYSALVADL